MGMKVCDWSLQIMNGGGVGWGVGLDVLGGFKGCGVGLGVVGFVGRGFGSGVINRFVGCGVRFKGRGVGAGEGLRVGRFVGSLMPSIPKISLIMRKKFDFR